MNKNLIAAVLVCVCTFFRIDAYAKDPCDSPMQEDLVKCVSDKLKKADTELNQNYQMISGKMSKIGMKKEKQKLIDAQRAWLKMRDEHCNIYQIFYEGGREEPIHHTGCLAYITQNRADELKAMKIDIMDPLSDDIK